jgi:lysophospholipase L1-like esterase
MSEQEPGARVKTFANVVLITGGIASVSLVVYLVYLYQWSGTRHFTSPLGPALYYFVPAIMSLLLFGSLTWSSARKVNFALVLVSTVISIYAAEATLSVWYSLPSVVQRQQLQVRLASAKKLGIPFDPRTKIEVIRDLRKRGIDAGPSLFPQLKLEPNNSTRESAFKNNGSDFLPLASISNKMTVVCNEGGQYLTYRSDAHGFNNPENAWSATPMAVVALGDSYVQGWCVSPEDNFVALIRQRYPATLNLGIEGDGPLTMLATLREYGERLKPKLVLWFYYEGNDLVDLAKERQTPLLLNYFSAGFTQNLFDRQGEIDRALNEYSRSIEDKYETRKFEEIVNLRRSFAGLSTVENLVKLGTLRQNFGLMPGEAQPISTVDADSLAESRARKMKDLIDLMRETLREANRSVQAWGGKIYFIYLPGRGPYESTKNGAHPDRDMVLQAVASVGLPIIDIYKVFTSEADPLSLFPMRNGGHYNEQGHQLVAEEVLRSIPSTNE